jgi:hypothetical protein
VKIIALKPNIIPMDLNKVIVSPNSKKAAIMGMNNDKRWAISVRTIPDSFTDMAKTTKRVGSNKAKSE